MPFTVHFRRLMLAVAGTALYLVTTTANVIAQTSTTLPDPNSQPTITVKAELVLVPVIVTDRVGNFVSGLHRESFRVYENGEPQRVTLFMPEDTPVTVGLLVDHSSSMRNKLADVSMAIYAFAKSSKAEDQMFVVDFNDEVSIEAPGGHAFTNDPQELEQAIAAVSARGQTALYDAVIAGLDRLTLGHTSKKALVIITDGGDNASHHEYADVLKAARQSGAVIYSITLVGDPSEEENPKLLERLCGDTGGISFTPQKRETVTDLSTRIARDLREQYTLAYVPQKDPDNSSFRTIQVRVTAHGEGKIHVRSRAGYSPRSDKYFAHDQGGETP
jgi:Ca-activated chloride channel family protein